MSLTVKWSTSCDTIACCVGYCILIRILRLEPCSVVSVCSVVGERQSFFCSFERHAYGGIAWIRQLNVYVLPSSYAVHMTHLECNSEIGKIERIQNSRLSLPEDDKEKRLT